jgi:SSS family solute:Na+ symporter
MGVDLMYAVIGLAVFSLVYSIYGGLSAVAWTDVVQVIFLILGGLVTTYLALDAISEGQGVLAGASALFEKAPQKFDMILSPDNEFYKDLPGISVLIGGMWIVNLNYWGCNQYITQRALAAKSLDEAQRGVIFAGYLKLLLPVIVVIPGIAAYILAQDTNSEFYRLMLADGKIKPDNAYPALLHQFVPVGLKGAAFAALAAAIVSSLSSMMNSTATIFTMDIYRNFFNKTSSEKNLVKIGRITSVVALVIAVIVAPSLGSLDQAFQFIQEFTGLVSPGIFAIFFFGLFWKRTTANAAFWVAILTLPLSWGFKMLFPALPFIDRMGLVFLIVSALAIFITLAEGKKDNPNAIILPKGFFNTSTAFNIGAIGIIVILGLLYGLFW